MERRSHSIQGISMNVRATLAAALAVTALSACSTTEYIMSTTEGRMIVSAGKPSLDDKAGIYTYKDANGKATTIQKADVVQIMER
jgi:hypothetical protein